MPLDCLDALVSLRDEWVATHNRAVYLSVKDFDDIWRDDQVAKVRCDA